jgi:hypothetical protein
MWGLGVPDDLEFFLKNFAFPANWAPSLHELTARYVAAFDSKNIAAVEDLLDAEFALEDPAGRFEGREKVAAYIKGIFDAHNTLSFQARNIFVDATAQVTIIEFELQLNDKKVKGSDIIHWKHNKIQELRAYLY